MTQFLCVDGTSRVGENEALPSSRTDPSSSLGHPPSKRLSRVSSRSKTQYQVPTHAALDSIPSNDEGEFSNAQELQTRATSFASKLLTSFSS